MIRKRKIGGALMAVALVVSLIGPGGPATAAPALGAPGSAAVAATGERGGTATRSVTLLTGDHVTLSATGAVAVRRGEGRQGIAFVTRRVAGHVHVIPSDAVPLLRAGRLDARLFDVTALLGFGYGDARGNLPLIVTSNPTARAAARSTVIDEGVTVVRELPVVNGLAVRADNDGLPELWKRLAGTTAGARTLAGGVATVWLDGRRALSLDVSVPQIGAPDAWKAGFDGAGVTVAVLDTGVDAGHPDLSGQVSKAFNFTEGEEDSKDRVGHGTHVASTIAGTGRASNGKYTGVAPKAKLLDGKVCVDGGCAESWLLAGMQWAAEEGADVVNMSLGGFDTPEADPLEQAVDKLTAEYGTLFVIAAGNDGADASISSPASADGALAVGAVDKRDELADFSSRGPRVDGALKPDITGPGVDIVAANSADGFLGEPGESYTTLSGTSMATPHVAGAAAILAQRRPDASPAELKALLMGSAKPNPKLGAFAQGAGRVDVARAITQTVASDPPAVSLGRQRWPHADDTPVSQTITYRNSGPDAVTLALATRVTGPTGKPAPAGMFSVGASSVTVPAGGQAAVTMTADTRVDGPDGYYTGSVTATGGGSVVTTPFAVDREVESYDVTVRHLDQTGAGANDFYTILSRTDRYGVTEVRGGHTAVTRVPKGPHALLSLIFTGAEDGGEAGETTMAFLAQPKISVTRDLTVTVDAREGRPLSVTVPKADASVYSADVIGEVVGEGFGVGFGVSTDSFDSLVTAQIGPKGSYPWFRTIASAILAKLDADRQPTDSPYLYQFSWRFKGRMITGLTKRVKQSELATVRAAHARQGAREANKFTFALYPDTQWALATGVPLRLPSTRTEYYNTDDKVTWQGNLEEIVQSEENMAFPAILFGPTLRYRAGKRYAEQWNRGVFSPSLLDPVVPFEYLTRTGDTMAVAVPTHSDGEHRAGYSAFESARVTVFRNGVKVGEEAAASAEIAVPAAAGRYRVEQDMTRGAPSVLSTRVSSAWTFNSRHVAGEEPKRLPISVVRFSPELSQENTAPAGRAFVIPVVVQPQPDSAAARPVTLTVKVSYDDGRTWTPAPVTKVNGKWQVKVQHPDQAGFVSLRASSRDAAGNTVEHTVIRAYQIVGK